MLLNVASDLLGFGLSAAALVARGVDNARARPELVAYRRAAGRRLAAYWKNRSVSAHPCVREYRRAHEQFGAPGEPPAPEKLITYVRRNRDFTASGAVVDCYNIVSARTLLSIGAHDLGKLAGAVTLRAATPQDAFTPLGETEPRPLPGGYAYADSRGTVICRLDTLQCEQTKVTPESRDVAFFLQGNACLPAAVLLKGAWLLSEMVTTFCGGAVELVSFFEGRAAPPAAPVRPHVSAESLQRLSLRKGTVLSAERLPGLPDLSAVTLRADGESSALALSSSLPAEAAGRELIAATDLRPLVAAGRAFTSYLPALRGAAGVTPVGAGANVPDGARVY